MRQLPAVEPRAETEATRFGEDWPGVFIRGDNAHGYATNLEMLLRGNDDPLARAVVTQLINLLRSSRI